MADYPIPGMENTREHGTIRGLSPGSDPEACVVDMRRQPTRAERERFVAQYRAEYCDDLTI